MFEHPANVAIGIEQVAKDACTGGTSLNAGRVFTSTGALNTEGALLCDALFAQAIDQIVLVAIQW